MPFAQYDKTTGLIAGTNSVRVDDAVLASRGMAQILVPDGVHGGNSSIDLKTLLPVALPASPPPVPDASIQLTAALLSAGAIQSTLIHKDTLVKVNAYLTSLGKPTIT